MGESMNELRPDGLPIRGDRCILKGTGELVTIIKEHRDDSDEEQTVPQYTLQFEDGRETNAPPSDLDSECALDVGGQVFRVPLEALCGEHEGDVLGQAEEPEAPDFLRFIDRDP